MLPSLFRTSLAVFAAVILQGCSKKAEPPDVAIPPPPRQLADTTPAAMVAAPAKPVAKKTSTDVLRLVAWNLEWFPGHIPEPTPEAEKEHMAGAKEALVELHPDVLMLEEIRDWKSAAELCGALPGLTVQVASAFEARPQNQVVASVLAADSAWSETWQNGAVSPPRGFSFAALELPGGKFLLTYALHLKSNLGDFAENVGMRQESVRQLLRHVESMLALYGRRGPCGVIVGGDFNTSSDDAQFSQEQTLRSLRAAGFHWTHAAIPAAQRVTIPGKNGFSDNCFDHIFTLGLGQPVASVQAFPGLSDHFPVIVELDLSKADFAGRLDVAAGSKLLPAKFVVAPKEALAGVIESSDAEAIRAAVGKIATVRGKVQRIGATANGSINFIDFAGSAGGKFTGIVRKDNLDAVTASLGGDLETTLSGKTVELHGEIVLFKDSPQIVVTAPSQIKVTR